MKPRVPRHLQRMALIPTTVLLCFATLSAQAEEIAVTPQSPDILLDRCLTMCKTPNFFLIKKPLPTPCPTATR